MNFNLFNYVLIIEKEPLVYTDRRVYGIHLIFMYDIMLYNCIAHTLHTIQTEIHGSEIKRHKHGMRNILLGIQFLYAGFCRIYRSSLYASGKTESTLFNTLTEKKKPIY